MGSNENEKPKPKTVDEYIRNAPKEARARLRLIRACVKASVPGAEESLKWGMPSISHRRILVMYAAFKDHISFFPTPGPIKAFERDLRGFRTSKGTIHFPYDRPLPLALIRKMTRFRAREEKQKDAKWRERKS